MSVLGFGCVSAACEAEPSSPDCDCDDVRRSFGGRNDGGGFAPLSALDDVTDGHCGGGVGDLEVARVQGRHLFELLDDFSCVLVAPALQIGVDEIVHGVKLFAGVALLVRGFSVRRGWMRWSHPTCRAA